MWPKWIKCSQGVVDHLLSETSKILANPQLEEKLSHLIHSLKETLQNLGDAINANHLGNLVSTSEFMAAPFYSFPLSLTTPEGPVAAQLKLHKNTSADKINPENMRLALLLDMPKLGEIVVNLQVFERNITGQILSARADTNLLIETQIDELRNNLGKQGYQIGSIIPGLLSEHQKHGSSDLILLESDYSQLSRVNLKA
jgi:hypothetical protein